MQRGSALQVKAPLVCPRVGVLIARAAIGKSGNSVETGVPGFSAVTPTGG